MLWKVGKSGCILVLILNWYLRPFLLLDDTNSRRLWFLDILQQYNGIIYLMILPFKLIREEYTGDLGMIIIYLRKNM